jgi:hypothetical protein
LGNPRLTYLAIGPEDKKQAVNQRTATKKKGQKSIFICESHALVVGRKEHVKPKK